MTENEMSRLAQHSNLVTNSNVVLLVLLPSWSWAPGGFLFFVEGSQLSSRYLRRMDDTRISGIAFRGFHGRAL